MIADETVVRQMFADFNRSIFRNLLPEIPFRFSNAKSYIAKFRYPMLTLGDPAANAHRCVIIFSRAFELERRQLEDVLIHEMIHYLIWLKKIKTESAHDAVFKKYMCEINRQFGRNIRISEKIKPIADSKPKKHIFCISNWENVPTPLITVCGMKTAKEIDSWLRKDRRVKSHKWYVSLSPLLNSFRKVRTCKAFMVNDPAMLQKIIEQSKEVN